MSTPSVKDLLKAIGNKNAAIVDESEFYDKTDIITTSIPILNVALSGSLSGGISPGLTMIGGESKSYKTMMALTCAKAYLDTYEESKIFFFDCEFGASKEYFVSVGLDVSRIVHIPIVSIEEFRNQAVVLLNALERGYKAFILLDSLGALASNKSIEDAADQKNTADMTRSKVISGTMRLVTPLLNMKNIPCVVINHVYDSMDKYAGAIMAGGKGVMYASNTALLISKSQIKSDSKELEGYKFKIKIVKSRFIREGMSLDFDVLYEYGVQNDSGISELAVEYGVLSSAGGWWIEKDVTTDEPVGAKFRSSSERYTQILQDIQKNTDFQEFVKKKFLLSY
jgi:RecA/RadA recombinase